MEKREMVLGLLIIVLLMLSAEVMPSEGASLTCPTVTAKISSCLSYVRGGAKPLKASACCNGVRGLDALANTVENRRFICSCLQSTAEVLKPQPSAVASLAGLCGATHPFSLSQNCATVP